MNLYLIRRIYECTAIREAYMVAARRWKALGKDPTGIRHAVVKARQAHRAVLRYRGIAK